MLRESDMKMMKIKPKKICLCMPLTWKKINESNIAGSMPTAKK
jgi:hypothetical protein